MSSPQNQGSTSAMERSGWERTADEARQRLSAGYGNVTECVTENPGSAMLVTFGVGFGLGVLIGYALSEPSPPPSRWYDLRTAEKVGRRVLDSIAGALPESFASRLTS